MPAGFPLIDVRLAGADSDRPTPAIQLFGGCIPGAFSVRDTRQRRRTDVVRLCVALALALRHNARSSKVAPTPVGFQASLAMNGNLERQCGLPAAHHPEALNWSEGYATTPIETANIWL